MGSCHLSFQSKEATAFDPRVSWVIGSIHQTMVAFASEVKISFFQLITGSKVDHSCEFPNPYGGKNRDKCLIALHVFVLPNEE